MTRHCPDCGSDDIQLLADDGRTYPSSGLDVFLTLVDGEAAIVVTAHCLDCQWEQTYTFEGEPLDEDDE